MIAAAPAIFTVSWVGSLPGAAVARLVEETLSVPAAVRETVAAFVAEHLVVQPHYRRTRTDARDEKREPLRKGRKG